MGMQPQSFTCVKSLSYKCHPLPILTTDHHAIRLYLNCTPRQQKVRAPATLCSPRIRMVPGPCHGCNCLLVHCSCRGSLDRRPALKAALLWAKTHAVPICCSRCCARKALWNIIPRHS